MRRLIDFLRYNGEKGMTISVYFYTAFYRLCILFIPMPRIEKMLGIRGEESPMEETAEHIKTAKLVAFHVNRVTMHTPWESKCLVRAMTARRILMKKNIRTTLYLGVGIKEEKMAAHAWLRCGSLYITGENGEGFSEVAKFKSF